MDKAILVDTQGRYVLGVLARGLLMDEALRVGSTVYRKTGRTKKGTYVFREEVVGNGE